jgi:cytochrome c peroxidase
VKPVTTTLFSALALGLCSVGSAQSLTPIQQLGGSIFFDENLSLNGNQACAACHGPEVGFTGPIEEFNRYGAVYEGSIPERFGNRKPPSAAYATWSPILHQEKSGNEDLWVGGNFWDGRATGDILGNPAADQALGPFLNPMEQALPDSACVVYRVCDPDDPVSYPVSFEDVWGEGACEIGWPTDVETVCATEGATVALTSEDRELSDMNYGNIGLSIANYEDSPEVNAFTSKFDYSRRGQAKLTQQEQLGWALFKGKAKCSACHTANGQEALFTDFTYDNLGVPKNPENPVYDYNPDFIDYGLGGYLQGLGYEPYAYEPELGKVKVPTLRNVDLRPSDDFVKAFGHNGYFKSLEQIVHFYNTRDVKDTCVDPLTTVADAIAWDCWPEPEVAENVNTDELGDLGLSPNEEAAIVAFLKTLSDGYMP